MKRLFIWLMLPTLLAGCGGIQAQKRLNSLDDTINAYRILLRWGQYEDALRYILFRSGKGESHTVDLEPLKQVRLASYDIVEKIVTPEETEANVVVTMTYYHEESNVLHTIRQAQLWWYDETRQRWFLEGDLPDFIGNILKDR